MRAIIRQALLEAKTLFGGATSASLDKFLSVLPVGLIDTSFMTETVSVLGVGVPTFVIYLVFLSD